MQNVDFRMQNIEYRIDSNGKHRRIPSSTYGLKWQDEEVETTLNL